MREVKSFILLELRRIAFYSSAWTLFISAVL